MDNKERLLAELDRCVLEMEDEDVIDVAREYVKSGYDAYDGITDGLAKGMEKAGDLFEEEEYFVPELLICSDAMYNGLEELKPYLKQNTSEEKCNIIIGVVEGDTHDIGKNLVKIMMETAGFKVYDLGRDVAVESFIEKVRELGSGIVCMSTLMTTTMPNMSKVIDALEEEGLRDYVKIMVGGGPLSRSYAERIGADAYTSNAAEAAKKAKELADELKRNQ
ncbi:cobalamin-binding protein [Peptacetobacter hominis]|uniref:Cobalamin-binding protein n=1 Tax=Peptacetobacter hominis TaxID=2743610 RepID=A0A544QYU4_9FIRM|nr:corrinoid protein [Peptacetobacter hominis]TQQ85840.1 cobalamin-binding protein [Peptacetobacter hominis]